MSETRLQSIDSVKRFLCECGRVKSDPHATLCRDCTLALHETLREQRATEARQHARTRAAAWARAMGFLR